MAGKYTLMGALGLQDQMSPTLSRVLGLVNATTHATERLNRAIGTLGRTRPVIRVKDEATPAISRIEQRLAKAGKTPVNLRLITGGATGQVAAGLTPGGSAGALAAAERQAQRLTRLDQVRVERAAREQERLRLRAERQQEQGRLRAEREAVRTLLRQQREQARASTLAERQAARALQRQQREEARAATLADRQRKSTLDALGRGVERVTGRLWGTGRSLAGGLFSLVTAPFRMVGGALTSLPGILGVAGGVAGVAWLVKGSLEFSSNMEQAQIAFTTMLGSAEKAKSFIQELWQFAAKTPFEFPDVQQGARMLLAMGFAAKEVVPWLTSIGNATSALGASQEVIQRVILAIGQIRAKGKLMGEEIRQLAETGIPVVEILAKKLGMAKEEIMEGGRAGIDAERALAALYGGLNERFGGGMLAQSRTFKGLFTTLKDNTMALLGGLGDGIRGKLQPRLMQIVDFFEQNPKKVAQWRQRLVSLGYSATKSLMDLFDRAMTRIGAMIDSPRFQQADFWGKLRIAWDELIGKPFADWWNSTGRQTIDRYTGQIADAIVEGLDKVAIPLGLKAAEIGIKIGEGLVAGLWEHAKKDPVLALVLGAGAGVAAPVPGPAKVGVAAAVAVAPVVTRGLNEAGKYLPGTSTYAERKISQETDTLRKLKEANRQGQPLFPNTAIREAKPNYPTSPLNALRRLFGLQEHARGGIFSQPHVGMVAEAGREAIIPLDGGARNRGAALWERAGEELGMGTPQAAKAGARETERVVEKREVTLHINISRADNPEDDEILRRLKQAIYSELEGYLANG